MTKKSYLPTIDWITVVLLLVGGLNWGLVVFDFDLVQWLTTAVSWPTLATILYSAVGLSAVWVLARSTGLVGKFMK